MNQENTSKKISLLEAELFSTDETRVLTALKTLKKDGKKSTVKALVELLSKDISEKIKTEILTLLQTLKVSDADEVFIDALKDETNIEVAPLLLNAFWMSNQNPQKHFSFLINYAIITPNYMSCFECLTILEAGADLFDTDDVVESVQKLKQQIDANHKHGKILASIKSAISEDVIG